MICSRLKKSLIIVLVLYRQRSPLNQLWIIVAARCLWSAWDVYSIQELTIIIFWID